MRARVDVAAIVHTTDSLIGQPRVAVIDDRPPRVNLVLRTLAGARFRARGFTSPREALDVLASVRFDAVITDHRMGEFDATTLCARLRDKHGAQAPRVVLLTRSIHDVMIPDRELFASILEKPVSPAGLLVAIERALAPVRAARRLA
ncbi:response regulator [Sandaracinus amylolyticus]|uniref:response regulator n=1 Tax=Sandaracinus amylolyticus TaxID=927083 RepID=UPI0014701CE9|nr:response regulator [Sandaracinus amylolyticus]